MNKVTKKITKVIIVSLFLVVTSLVTVAPGLSSVNWNSVNWNSVNWNSVTWGSVNWAL